MRWPATPEKDAVDVLPAFATVTVTGAPPAVIV
jgi:hypothetical protein